MIQKCTLNLRLLVEQFTTDCLQGNDLRQHARTDVYRLSRGILVMQLLELLLYFRLASLLLLQLRDVLCALVDDLALELLELHETWVVELSLNRLELADLLAALLALNRDRVVLLEGLLDLVLVLEIRLLELVRVVLNT